MKNLMRGIGIILVVGFSNWAFAEDFSTWKLSPDGLGPIHIGMNLKQAETASSEKFSNTKPDPSYESESCFYATFKDKKLEGVSLMLSDGKIVRIDITSPEFSTTAGAHVGDTETQIKSLYKGKLQIEQHHYESKGHYLTYKPNGNQRGIRFETDGKKVTVMYAGRNQEIQYVEGCL